MSRPTLTVLLALCLAGCVNPGALTRGARRIGGRFTPAARDFARDSQRVVRFAGQAADDAALAARVKTALVIHKGLEGCAVHVASENSVICLSGTVQSPRQKRLAAGVAEETVGVAGVRDHLQVRGRP